MIVILDDDSSDCPDVHNYSPISESDDNWRSLFLTDHDSALSDLSTLVERTITFIIHDPRVSYAVVHFLLESN